MRAETISESRQDAPANSAPSPIFKEVIHTMAKKKKAAKAASAKKPAKKKKKK